MEFALRHAQTHQLNRVVVAVPLTAILEQNADVYRRALGDDAILEHHSSIDVEDPKKESPRTRVASENWDVPVVVTTTVQLFESLFSNRTSRCRKLHNLVRSVIVLDEAQALPVPLMNTILDGLKTLVRDYNVSVVFSTATQPAFRQGVHFKQGLEGIREIVPSELGTFLKLRRVCVEWPSSEEPKSWQQLSAELVELTDVLAIVHKRNDARELCLLLDRALESENTMHLSALMCPLHRSKKLQELKARRANKESVRLVSTQLVEAGVDVDFPVVYRAFGGLDSVAQAAGRCNREGLRAEGVLKVFFAQTKPPLGLSRTAFGVTRALLRAGPLSIDDPDSFRKFFQSLYPIADLDKKQLQAARAELRFKDVGKAFQMVEDDWSAPVVVPWNNADELMVEHRARPNRTTYRKLQRLTVNVARKLRDKWLAVGVAEDIDGVVFVRPKMVPYDERFGLRIDLDGVHSATDLIVDG
jgi:CRISPR-associated endonuclease/helicase Cas3